MHDYGLIKSNFSELKAELQYAKNALSKENQHLEKLKIEEQDALTARLIIQQVAEETQQHLKESISSLVTLAINTVFPDDDVQFDVDIVQKRGKIDASFFIVKNGKRIDDLLDSDGGGLADIISIALRVAFLRISGNKFKCLILDEPTKFLHNPEAQSRVNEMIMMIAEDLNIQFIIVSDQDELIGHKRFVVKHGNVMEEK